MTPGFSTSRCRFWAGCPPRNDTGMNKPGWHHHEQQYFSPPRADNAQLRALRCQIDRWLTRLASSTAVSRRSL